MRGLVIKKEPMAKILSGLKTWEMRSSRTKIRGRIALIEGGSGTIVGTADLVESIGPLTHKELTQNVDKHQATPQTVSDNFSYKQVYAWRLENVRSFVKPLPYKHPSGAVIWVDLSTIEHQITTSKTK